MADIHQQKDHLQHPGAAKIPLNHFPPLFLCLQGYLGIAVSGQVNIVEGIVDIVEIDGLGLARLGGSAGVGLAVHQGVNQG